jgi:aromatic-L-amino-acid decarboxylase
VLYGSDQIHSSIERGCRVLGLEPAQIRKLPSDEQFRLPLTALRGAVADDRAAGRQPFCVIANAGSTNTGAVDPLPALAEYWRDEGLWLHADAAYGAAAILCERGRALLEGLDRVDSLSLDPHKWWFQPYEIGCVLVRNGHHLRETFRILPEYLKDVDRAAEEVNFCEYGIQLTRSFRALKLWMSLQVFGLDAFRQAVARGVALAEQAEQILRQSASWEIVTPAQLGIVTFRPASAGRSAAQVDAQSRWLVDAVIADGFAMVSSTELRGRTVLRLCTINPRTTDEEIRETLRRLERFGERRLETEKPEAGPGHGPIPETGRFEGSC